MEISIQEEKTALVVTVAGRIDATTAPEFEQRIVTVAQDPDGPTRLVLDMSQVGYISSAGLRVILLAAKKLKARRGELLLAAMQDTVREIFDISGFLSILKAYDTLEAALAQG